MGFSTEFTEHDDWLSVVSSGHLDSAETYASYFEEIVRRLTASGGKRVLMDNRQVKVDIDACDASQVARDLVEQGVPALGIRYAVLCAEPVAGSCRFLETTFRNNSLRFHIFPTEAQAIEWLTA